MSDTKAREAKALPQYGFVSEFAFAKLAEDNRFLFRVYTPRARSPFDDPSDPYFLGGKFKGRSTSELHLSKQYCVDESIECLDYEDVAKHMDWTTRSSSPFVTTSFSFAWAIWEAVRRYRLNVKHDVEIAVIDASMVSEKAVTALELLRKATGKQRNKDYWKWYRFALESQDVLVFGDIPGEAVFASIPLGSLLEKLPSYFLTDENVVQADSKKPSVFDRVSWEVSTKANHRQFCQTLSERFLRLPAERRICESTAGAVRLSVCLLHPWFRAKVPHDFAEATATVTELAVAIARWPAAWWARDHPELADMIRSMVEIAGEEIRENDRVRVLEEIERFNALVEEMQTNEHACGRDTPSITHSDGSEDGTDSEQEEVASVLARDILRMLEPRQGPSLDEKTCATQETLGVQVVDEIDTDADADANLKTPKLETPPKSQERSVQTSPIDDSRLTSFEEEEWGLGRISSWAVTTFLSGVIVTLFVVSSQRRELANMLT